MLSDYFYYSETSPSFLRRAVDSWKSQGHSVLAYEKDSACGTISVHGYYMVENVNAGKRRAHRVIWELFNGTIPKGMEIDHIDGCKTNNNISNLRMVTKDVNARNRAKNGRNTSGTAGVSRHTNGNGRLYWCARWCDLSGKEERKLFSIENLGEDKAFNLACEYRDKMIYNLNVAGAGYTERHGQ